MPAPLVALTVILLGLTGLFSIAVVSACWKLADRKGAELSANHVRRMATGLGVVLALLGASCLWLAYLVLDWAPRS